MANSVSPDLMLFNGKEYRIISDQVGTPKMLIDTSTGKIVRKFDFDEFGVTKDHREDDFDRGETMNIPFGFAGGLFDRSTGLVRFGAREYDPEIGKWLSKDPLLFGGGNTNLYFYSTQDPINNVDPGGKDLSSVGACVLNYSIPSLGISEGILLAACASTFAGDVEGLAACVTATGYGSIPSLGAIITACKLNDNTSSIKCDSTTMCCM